MPLIQIYLVEGRTDEQKRDLLAAVTEAAREAVDAPIETIRVWLHELPATQFMVAGELQADRRRRSAEGPTDQETTDTG